MVFTFLWLEALGECCPNFDTLALFKRRENATQILIFMLWLGHQKEPKSHQNPPQIDNKSSKLVLGMTLGTPGLPLEASWAPLGAPTPKTIKKVTWWTPPREAFWAQISHFLVKNRFWSVFFDVPFSASFFYRFLAAPGYPKTMKIKQNPCSVARKQELAKVGKTMS